jgi:hypothetical protein
MFLAITALSLCVGEEWRSSENETMEPKMCNTVKSVHSFAARKRGIFSWKSMGEWMANESDNQALCMQQTVWFSGSF